VRVDDVDACVRAIAQVVLGAIRIDPADVERTQRITGDLDCGQALGFGVGRRARPGAGAERRAADAERCGTGQRMRNRKASKNWSDPFQ